MIEIECKKTPRNLAHIEGEDASIQFVSTAYVSKPPRR